MAVQAGRQVFIYVDTTTGGTGGTNASWTKIGQQRGGSFSRSIDTADGTHKDDDGWASGVATRVNWSVSVDGALNPSDTAWAFLIASAEAKTKVYILVDAGAIGGEEVEGAAWITDLSYEFPEGDVVSYTVELQGDGPLATAVNPP